MATQMTRWSALSENSPSGCVLFQCRVCRSRPTKVPTATCSAGCYDGPVAERFGWRYLEVWRGKRLGIAIVTLLVFPWGEESPRVKMRALSLWQTLRDETL